MIPFGLNFPDEMKIPEDNYSSETEKYYDPSTQVGRGASSSDTMVRSRTYPSDSTETEEDD